MVMSDRMVPVVLCGGTGTRLWPMSRAALPKQFLALLSDDSMLVETLRRAAGAGFAPPIVVAGEAHRFQVAEAVQSLGVEGTRILLEPAGRNSAPAIAAAAVLAAREHGPEAMLWIMASDAAIGDLAALQERLPAAATAARAGRIVTFGMTPTSAETGYGYIERGEPLPGVAGAYAVQRFVEKPDSATAARLVADGRYSWNSGMFVATAATLLEELGRLAPEVRAAAETSVDEASADLGFLRLDPQAFARAPSISIDYAVMERTARAAVLPAEIGWSDVGSWDALWQVSPKDAAGNAIKGPVELLDCEGCLIRSDGRLVAAAGLRDIVLVVTPDAVLALPRSRAQDVKRIVEALAARGLPQATEHQRVYRPWGNYEGLIRGERFQVKQITVRPGGKLSLQKHFHRAEHWVVVHGTARIERDGESLTRSENESVYLPLGAIHRLENPGKIPLVLIEVQVGSYLGEDDIVRIEDSYGRG